MATVGVALVSACVGGLVLAAPSRARGERTVRLEYEVGPSAETCPGSKALRGSIRVLLGYDPFADAAPRTIRVRVDKGPRGFEAVIDLYEASGLQRGLRRLESSRADCAELARSLVFALTIVIDPLWVGRPSRPRVEAPPPTAPPRHVPALQPGEASATTKGTPPARLVAVSAHGAVGGAPAPALGFEALAGLRYGRLSLRFAGRYDVPAFADAKGGRISAWVVLASGLGCMHHGYLAGCAVVGGGIRRLAGHDLENARRVTQPAVIGGVRAALELPLSENLAAYVHVDVLGEVIETVVHVGGVRTWDTSVVSAAGGAGVLAVFP